MHPLHPILRCVSVWHTCRVGNQGEGKGGYDQCTPRTLWISVECGIPVQYAIRERVCTPCTPFSGRDTVSVWHTCRVGNQGEGKGGYDQCTPRTLWISVECGIPVQYAIRERVCTPCTPFSGRDTVSVWHTCRVGNQVPGKGDYDQCTPCTPFSGVYQCGIPVE